MKKFIVSARMAIRFNSSSVSVQDYLETYKTLAEAKKRIEALKALLPSEKDAKVYFHHEITEQRT